MFPAQMSYFAKDRKNSSRRPECTLRRRSAWLDRGRSMFLTENASAGRTCYLHTNGAASHSRSNSGKPRRSALVKLPTQGLPPPDKTGSRHSVHDDEEPLQSSRQQILTHLAASGCKLRPRMNLPGWRCDPKPRGCILTDPSAPADALTTTDALDILFLIRFAKIAN